MGLPPRFLYPFESNTVTTTLTKRQPLPIDITDSGYTDKELGLIQHCWSDASEINKSKVSLAKHLYELKKELDNGDNGAGAGCVKSRFWAAFEAGHLPLQGDKGRRSVETCLTAAGWLASNESRKGLRDSLRNLAPATICEISELSEEAQAVVYRNLASSEFIGVAAVRLLRRISEADILKRLDTWIDAHEGKALTPATISKIEAEAAQAERKASTPAHLKPQATASSPEVIDYQPPTITAEQRHQRNQELLREQNIRDTRAAIEAPEREEAAELAKFHKLYADALAEAVRGLTDLRRALSTISSVKGTIYLDELRDYQGPLGFNYLENDVAELQRCKDTLIEVVKLATSRTGPQSIDWETINTEAQ